MPVADLLLLMMLGLVVGSFVGLLVLRIPKGEPVIVARSSCPHCGRELTAMELIPVVSWVVQGRRCRTCKAALSSFYPAMEVAGAAVAVASGLLLSGLWIIAGCVVGWTLLALAGLQLSNLGSGTRL